ncbi:MAG: hypothetical protein GF308_09400 [Candidatus Heimdallarchaeota archaeon]|nr:hypothetical protein [Candidatus Heimdallarchaeota archaeon]
MTKSKPSKKKSTKKKSTKKKSTKKKSTKKKSTKKKKLSKEEKDLQNLSNYLEEFNSEIIETINALPSLVILSQIKDKNKIEKTIQEKVAVNFELIEMLEDFFKKIVELLRLRAQIDQKMALITRYVKKLRKIKKIGEFKGNLQLLGITLNDCEKIIRNYQELYSHIFSEHAIIQFQLMEQLILVREQEKTKFKELFDSSREIFQKMSEKFVDST